MIWGFKVVYGDCHAGDMRYREVLCLMQKNFYVTLHRMSLLSAVTLDDYRDRIAIKAIR